MDIGGSLTKIAYYSTLPLKKIVYDNKDNDQVKTLTSNVTLKQFNVVEQILVKGKNLLSENAPIKSFHCDNNPKSFLLTLQEVELTDDTVYEVTEGARLHFIKVSLDGWA